jgi:hypothetical protein
VRIQSSLVRSGTLCGLTLGACLLASKPAAAEVTLVETNGWSFFTDGRVNAFVSYGVGDAFPRPTQNTNLGPDGRAPQHGVVGSGQPFTAGYESTNQADANNGYNGMRIRNGFLATILGLGIKRKVSDTTTATGYIALWGTAQTYARDRVQDSGKSTSKGFDVRSGYVELEGPWGGVTAGRQGGLFGGLSAEIDFLYGHNYGLGLPCVDDYYASCGHIGTGALGPGNAAGFVYSTPSFGGLKLRAGLFDPVRLLGIWERVPIPRPEGSLTFEQQVSPSVTFKLGVEGMYQPMKLLGADQSTEVWGVAGGGRLEAGPIRLGLSAFRGKGLGAYVALQNSGSSFNQTTKELRSFTGLYAQSALVLGKWQVSLGVGEVIDDQLDSDKIDVGTSNLKRQMGISLGLYYSLTENIALGVDYFRFQTDWWGAPNSTDDAMMNPVVLSGYLAPEKQVINFFNAGATFHW